MLWPCNALYGKKKFKRKISIQNKIYVNKKVSETGELDVENLFLKLFKIWWRVWDRFTKFLISAA